METMDLKPRFIFHASAAAFGGRMVRPSDVLIDSGAASALTSTGGRSTGKAKKMSFGKFARFGGATTLAEGTFDDPKAWADSLCCGADGDTLTTSTRVRAELVDVALGVKPRFTAKRIAGGFDAKSAGPSGEPSIRVSDDTVIEGASIDGYKLVIELNVSLFQQNDTLSKLRAASDDPRFVKNNGDHLFIPSRIVGRTVASPPGRLAESGDRIYGTIVKSIRWAGKPYPGAVIDRHVLTLPDCLQIFFGEIQISRLARRLTLARFHFCCPPAAVYTCCDFDDNGTWGI
jgi:hypothetical protein